MADRQPRFGVGTQFKTSGKHPRLRTVTDVWRTYNLAGEQVALRYVATHEFMGQTVTERDVVETTIAKNLVTPS